MFRTLPSPSALRTFESAARLKSFKLASKELGVTPTAVSHQVRSLEASLGLALFVRKTRLVSLTPAGKKLAAAVHGGFLEIKAALEEIGGLEKTLTVTTTPAFATLCLVEKLAGFNDRHPGIRVALETGTKPVDLKHDPQVDVAIRYGPGPYPDFFSVPLLKEYFGAFCSPGFLKETSDFPKVPLLETAWAQPVLKETNWAAWLEAAGYEKLDGEFDITRFDEEQYVLQTAIAGQGVVLASSALVGGFLSRGLLVPFRPEITLPGGAYTALCLKEKADTAKVRKFLAWLKKAFPETQP